MYVLHPSIAFAVLGYSREMLVEKILGQYVESVFAGDFFWRDRQKNEVDVVLENKALLPIEVRFQSQITSSDFKGLMKCMEEFGLEKGMLATRDVFEKRIIGGKEILLMSAIIL